MPAHPKASQKFKHLGLNVYQIITKGQALARPRMSSRVLKVRDLNRVDQYVPVDLGGKRPASDPVNPSPVAPDLFKATPSLALENMTQNLKRLKDLQLRFRFVLKELEELVHE